MKKFPDYPEKILIRSTNWIGDAIMTTPAVRSIRNHFPDSEITMLLQPWVGDVFRFSPQVDELFLYEKQGRHAGLKGKLRLASELRRKKFDAAILLQNAFEAAFITALAGIPARGGYTTDGRALLLTNGVKKPADIKTRHQVHYYQEMVRGLGIAAGPDKLELVLPGSKKNAAESALQTVFDSIGGRVAVVGLNPGAAYGPAKRWPAQKFSELAEMLCRQTDSVIIIFGTDDDRDTAMQIKDCCTAPERVVDLTGKTKLVEAMAFIDCCTAFVTNDSGLMHVAAALETPLVAIFGSTDHIATGPFSTSSKVIRKPLECSPCKETHCPEKHLQCMQLINPRDVFEAVHQLIVQQGA